MSKLPKSNNYGGKVKYKQSKKEKELSSSLVTIKLEFQLSYQESSD